MTTAASATLRPFPELHFGRGSRSNMCGYQRDRDECGADGITPSPNALCVICGAR